MREELDLGATLSAYTEARGFPPYDPGMMVALLLYAYSQGVYSSRRIAHDCKERLDFQAVTALNQLDFRTISEFRRRHLVALGELFVQVLALCQRAGLVGLGHVAVDGTKLRANASKHKAMSYARMVRAEAELQTEVQAWLDRAAATDAAEDAEHGADRRGDEMPEWMADKQLASSASAPLVRSSKPKPRPRRRPSRFRAQKRTARRLNNGAVSPPSHQARRNPRRSVTLLIPTVASCWA